jgi:hypothetical protein
MRGRTGFSQKAVPEDHRKRTGHVAGPRVFHGMVVPVVRDGADVDAMWGCVRRAWGAHEAAWLCCRGEAQYRSRVSTSIRKSNKIAKIPGKFVSPRIESWESHHQHILLAWHRRQGSSDHDVPNCDWVNGDVHHGTVRRRSKSEVWIQWISYATVVLPFYNHKCPSLQVFAAVNYKKRPCRGIS